MHIILIALGPKQSQDVFFYPIRLVKKILQKAAKAPTKSDKKKKAVVTKPKEESSSDSSSSEDEEDMETSKPVKAAPPAKVKCLFTRVHNGRGRVSNEGIMLDTSARMFTSVY